MNDDFRLCIDFGTAFSKAAIARTTQSGGVDPLSVRPLPIGHVMGEAASPFFAPGAIFIRKDGQAFFGSRARQHAREAGGRREMLLSFKTFLSDSNLSAGLEFLPPKEIDPTGEYRRADLVILFLAWIMRAIDLSLKSTDASYVTPRLRYTTPAWSLPPVLASVTRLFDDARFVAAQLGDTLSAEDGVPLTAGIAASRAARAREVFDSVVEGAVLEAVAAASCHAFHQRTTTYLLVFDIGAGTTDLAALRVKGDGVSEISAARRTLQVAGDDLDMLVLELFLAGGRRNKSLSRDQLLWSEALISIKAAKHELFNRDRASFTVNGRPKSARLRDLTSTRNFKQLQKVLNESYLASLCETACAAEQEGGDTVHVVLAGGGAHLPFVQKMVNRAPPPRPKMRVTVLPVIPEWTQHAAFGGSLSPFFPQLAVAIGGASAPGNLLLNSR